ncbi:YibE/F family protein [Mediterraneibacter gnavus]|uniref:YibE/F family protein n=1 Tax=Mediterraneibacter gnavus TaxID=33038 RepID=UPI00356A09EB
MREKRKKAEQILMLVIVITMIFMCGNYRNQKYGFQTGKSDENVYYVRAEVQKVIEQEMSYSESDKEYELGYQKLMVRVLEGEFKGQELVIDNYITVQHHVVLTENSKVIVCIDCPDGVEPYYSIYNYDRSDGLIMVLGIFVLLVAMVGGRQGVRSCIALLFTLLLVFCYLLPHLFEGDNAAGITMITVSLSCAVTCFCIGGISKKTILNVISAVLGGVSAGLLYEVFSKILSISGCNMDEAETLALVARTTGLRLEGVLFAAVTVASLGAVMDVAVSLGASLFEISNLNPNIERKELFRSGMNIGKDMIGTMTNTLILAFAGGTLSTLLVFVAYGVQFHQLISSNLLALEVAKGLAGSAAVVMTVPISAAVCALGYGKNKTNEGV